MLRQETPPFLSVHFSSIEKRKRGIDCSRNETLTPFGKQPPQTRALFHALLLLLTKTWPVFYYQTFL